MKVEQVMTREVSYCAPATSAAAAAEMMWTRDCGALPILDEGKHLVGMVTDRDLFIALGTSNRTSAALPVGEIMSHEISYCRPSDSVRSALRTMAEQQIHRLPVLDKEGDLKGILSLHDIVLRTGTNDIRNEDVLNTMKAICAAQIQRKAAQPQQVEAHAAVA